MRKYHQQPGGQYQEQPAIEEWLRVVHRIRTAIGSRNDRHFVLVDDFETVVLDLVRARIPQAEHIEVTRRDSRTGKYQALTLTFTVHTQQQLEDIYRDLYDCDQVVMSL